MLKKTNKGGRFPILILTAMGLLAGSAVHAVPILQLYIEGATYDDSDESWYTDYASGDTLRIWAIGNVDGEGGKGKISNVRMAIAYPSSDTASITVTPTTGGYLGYTDPSPANAVIGDPRTVTDGSSPLLSNGSPIPSHDIYGPGTTWTEFTLGDFERTDALAGDFTGAGLPTPTGGYDVNVYEVVVSGTANFHVDLYDNIVSGNHAKSKFAPFSHDGAGTMVPDGGVTLILFGISLMGLTVCAAGMNRLATARVRA